MFNFLRKKVLQVKYYRIRKPKRNEMLIFNLKDDISVEDIYKFKEELKKAINDINSQNIIITANCSITIVKKKQIKIKGKNENTK